jgi:hypothetical protein
MPLVITDEELEEGLGVLESVLAQVNASQPQATARARV